MSGAWSIASSGSGFGSTSCCHSLARSSSRIMRSRWCTFSSAAVESSHHSVDQIRRIRQPRFSRGLPQLVAVARGCRPVKLRAVGFDPGEIDTRLVGMDDSEIDPKVGDANLRMNDPVPGFQRAFDRFFERRFRVAAG
jgi:hypothetical protein